MASSGYKKKGIVNNTNRDAVDKFFLYVAFHSAWTAVVNFFRD